jgi:hypothetical protein
MTLLWYHPIISGQKAQNSLTDCVNKSLIFNQTHVFQCERATQITGYAKKRARPGALP